MFLIARRGEIFYLLARSLAGRLAVLPTRPPWGQIFSKSSQGLRQLSLLARGEPAINFAGGLLEGPRGLGARAGPPGASGAGANGSRSRRPKQKWAWRLLQKSGAAATIATDLMLPGQIVGAASRLDTKLAPFPPTLLVAASILAPLAVGAKDGGAAQARPGPQPREKARGRATGSGGGGRGLDGPLEAGVGAGATVSLRSVGQRWILNGLPIVADLVSRLSLNAIVVWPRSRRNCVHFQLRLQLQLQL